MGHSPASALLRGEQKQLEVRRALLLQPKALFVDEPSIGLSPLVVKDVFRLPCMLAEKGTTVLVVEQNAVSALKLVSKAVAWKSERVELPGRADEWLAEPDTERLFLEAAHAAKGTQSVFSEQGN